ncbi:ABC transporter permease [Sulfuricurvum sp.]|uniref:ABC transporter permease n=1 Tax=Sulfuricurvum sp. TaxID=2025608 RepID=UPI002616934F|nr:ABC transporter permease [Sulfuricurvum sp.]MDD2266033.1 ABC transporter permease [Sulfuricurvum sp.]MDD2783045.1 ABC transporter permease [Sulfuricurvum sp.]
MNRLFKSLWHYRTFVISSVVAQFHARFVQNKLGVLWMIANPLAQVTVYALILSSILAAKLPGINNTYAYAIYLTAGMLAWTLFTEILSRSVTLFVDNANLLKKLAFPKLTLPLIVTGTALINALLLLVAAMGVFFLLGHHVGWVVLWLPLLFVLTILLALSLGTLLGIFNVFIRDIGQLVPIVIQFWFWLTPVVYVPTIIPVRYRDYLAYNPVTPLVQGFQNVLVFNRPPDVEGLALIALVSLLIGAAAIALYRKASAEMVDLL